MKATALVLAAVLLVTGCSTAANPLGEEPTVGVQPTPAGAKEVRTLDEPSVDRSCGDPTASYRPQGPLPPPRSFTAGSYMATIQLRGRLVVGVDQNTLGFAYRDPESGEIQGFALDVAREIANALLGDPNAIQLRVLTSAQRIDAVKNGDVDLVVHSMTTNCERWKDVDFSSVFFEAAQRVLVKEDFAYEGVQSLAGKKVCATEGSTSLARIVNADVDPRPIGVQVAGWTDCLVMLQQNQVDAISTDDTILAGLRAQDPFTELVGDELAQEPYAIAMPKDHVEFVRFVNAVLERMRADGTWTRLYDDSLAELLGPATPPPARYLD
jgi:polar amino acid transport system substrate-binding protein